VCGGHRVSEVLLTELDVERVEPERAEEVRHESFLGLVDSRRVPRLEPFDERLHRPIPPGDRERGRFDHGERPHQVGTASRGQKAEDTAIGMTDNMCPATESGDEIVDLGVEVEPHRGRALAVPAPVDEHHPVLVGQLPLLGERLLGVVEAAVDEHDRLALAELDDVQIGRHPHPRPGRQSELCAPYPRRPPAPLPVVWQRHRRA
jgi:hypothetical protein